MVNLEKKIQTKTLITTYLGTTSDNVVDSQEVFPESFREGALIPSEHGDVRGSILSPSK